MNALASVLVDNDSEDFDTEPENTTTSGSRMDVLAVTARFKMADFEHSYFCHQVEQAYLRVVELLQ
jgi:hypothetical protein